jgi:hypothetical protein
MKFRALTTALVLFLAAAAGWIAYACLRESPRELTAGNHDDALLWLRSEFKLSGEKLARIEAMHAAYQIVCEDHCRAIRDSRRTLKQLRDAKAPPHEIAAAETKAKEVDAICTTSLETHMREIADVIGGDDGRRYLSVVLPRIAGFDHAAAPGLDLDSAKPHAGHHHH